ncbi:hypothetical protein GGR61_000332 [Xanthomonas arboricola]|nr:hypothetical protein [Xanthomonas sp. 3075]MBB5862746.1 hypothetical protein [Xanthomonas sp. 3058]
MSVIHHEVLALLRAVRQVERVSYVRAGVDKRVDAVYAYRMRSICAWERSAMHCDIVPTRRRPLRTHVKVDTRCRHPCRLRIAIPRKSQSSSRWIQSQCPEFGSMRLVNPTAGDCGEPAC